MKTPQFPSLFRIVSPRQMGPLLLPRPAGELSLHCEPHQNVHHGFLLLTHLPCFADPSVPPCGVGIRFGSHLQEALAKSEQQALAFANCVAKQAVFANKILQHPSQVAHAVCDMHMHKASCTSCQCQLHKRAPKAPGRESAVATEAGPGPPRPGLRHRSPARPDCTCLITENSPAEKKVDSTRRSWISKRWARDAL